MPAIAATDQDFQQGAVRYEVLASAIKTAFGSGLLEKIVSMDRNIQATPGAAVGAVMLKSVIGELSAQMGKPSSAIVSDLGKTDSRLSSLIGDKLGIA